MINIGNLLDFCGISYTEKQLVELDKLVNELWKKLSLQQFDSKGTKQQRDSTLDSEDKSSNEDFYSETKLKPMEKFDFKSDLHYDNTIKEEILEESDIEIKEEPANDPFASLETFNNSENVSDMVHEENLESIDSSHHYGLKPLRCKSEDLELEMKIKSETSESSNEANLYSAVDKEFKCNDCNAAFSSEIFHGMHGKRNYKMHVKNHEKPAKPAKPGSYKCSECKKIFPLKAQLNRHIKCVHNFLEKPKKTYNCAMCNKYFSYPSLLIRHMKQVHESSTNCLICDKNYSFPSQLKNHMAKKNCSMSKKIDYALNFDTGPIQISEVVDYQQEKIDSQTEKDEIAAQTSLSNNEQTKKSRRKQKIALRKDF